MAYNRDDMDMFTEFEQSYMTDYADGDDNIYYSELEDPQAYEDSYPLISWKKTIGQSIILGLV